LNDELKKRPYRTERPRQNVGEKTGGGPTKEQGKRVRNFKKSGRKKNFLAHVEEKGALRGRKHEGTETTTSKRKGSNENTSTKVPGLARGQLKRTEEDDHIKWGRESSDHLLEMRKKNEKSLSQQGER